MIVVIILFESSLKESQRLLSNFDKSSRKKNNNNAFEIKMADGLLARRDLNSSSWSTVMMFGNQWIQEARRKDGARIFALLESSLIKSPTCCVLETILL